MLGILSGLSPKVVGGLILALALSLGAAAGLFWLVLEAHEEMGSLQSKYDTAKAQLKANEEQHKQDRAAWEKSLAARDAALSEAKGRASRLSNLLADAGENDDALDRCLHEVQLPDSAIVGLPK